MKFDGNVWFTYLIYSLIAIVAFLGNAFVLYVLATRSSYLKTSCKIFICNLAITDLITSIMLIFSRYLYLPAMPDGYIGRKMYCKTIWSACFQSSDGWRLQSHLLIVISGLNAA